MLTHDSQPKWSGCWDKPVNNADSIINGIEMGLIIQDIESKYS